MVERYDPAEDDYGISPLRRRREECGVTQKAMAKAIGVSEETYRRLESGKKDDPGVRLLHNCALALGTSLYKIIPEEWYGWTVFSDDATKPPWWGEFFDFGREGADALLSIDLPEELAKQLPDVDVRKAELFGPE